MKTLNRGLLNRSGCSGWVVGSLVSGLILSSAMGCGTKRNGDDASASEVEGSNSSKSTYGILNFRQVNDQLFRSGHPNTYEFKKIKKMGIQSVLSLEPSTGSPYASNSEGNLAAAMGIRPFSVPMSGSAKPTLSQINRALKVIEDPANQPVLVHCKYGEDRTGIVVAAYRIKHDRWSVERAKSEMRQLGHYDKLYWWDDVLDQFAAQLPASSQSNAGTPASSGGATPAVSSSNPGVSPSVTGPSVLPPDDLQLPVIGDAALVGNRNVALGVPRMHNQPEIVISRAQYVLSWNSKRRGPNWAAWEVQGSDLGSVGRQNNFATDGLLKTYLASKGTDTSVGPDDYSGSCLDRGHQVPSADRTDSVQSNAATFVMSNMIPQAAYLNRVVWERVESYERSLVSRTGGSKVYVIAGGIYDQGSGAIGSRHDIAVPSKGFKIIVKSTPGQQSRVMAAVILPNNTSAGTNPLTDRQTACSDSTGSFDMQGWGSDSSGWHQYDASVAQIENQANIDLSFIDNL